MPSSPGPFSREKGEGVVEIEDFYGTKTLSLCQFIRVGEGAQQRW